MIVPTADTVRYTYLLDTLVRANRPILLTGLTGTYFIIIHLNEIIILTFL